jgi:D-glutamate cyclase
LAVVTSFFIPTANPPAFETDGPLGAAFLLRAFLPLGATAFLLSEFELLHVFRALAIQGHGVDWLEGGIPTRERSESLKDDDCYADKTQSVFTQGISHLLAIERVGPSSDGRSYSMRGRDITSFTSPAERLFKVWPSVKPELVTIGIGDGGNEIGMGKIPHETIVKNIPNGDLIHCRVATDHLIVAGVSNWGAYALAAGVYVLRGVNPPPDLFDPDREREILEVMVREGPLVDGVTGKQTATVDGLSWEEYVKPMIRIREILES